MKIFKQITLIFVGLVFIASAVLKLFSIESFENYIYSFGLFGFGLCNVAARLLVAFEAFLGLCLCFGLFARKTWWVAVTVLSAFSVFFVCAGYWWRNGKLSLLWRSDRTFAFAVVAKKHCDACFAYFCFSEKSGQTFF
jgi:uncharacterized membrane protein YphA (DoxX/SURF4 family)